MALSATLTIIEGPDRGASLRLEPGREHLIGRSDKADLRLADPAVAWEHAVVRLAGRRVELVNRAARDTTVNGRAVRGPTSLRQEDRVALSPGCVAQLEIAGGALFTPLRAAAVAALLLLVVVGLVALTAGGDEPHPPLQRIDATEQLEAWLARQHAIDGADRQLLLELFREAHRHEYGGNHELAAAAWADLHLILSHSSVRVPAAFGSGYTRVGLPSLAREHPAALVSLLRRELDDLDDARRAAALIQYVRRSLRQTLR